MPFQIIRNDITRVKADAIVNTANPKPCVGGGTDSAIYEAAGKEMLLEQRREIGNIAPGQAVSTDAFNLSAKYIIHTVGPAWIDGSHGERETLHQCYSNSLSLAAELKCKSVAFPLISSGIYGFPKDVALVIALSEIRLFLQAHDMKVILVVFDRTSLQLSEDLVGNIEQYIDDNSAGVLQEQEHGSTRDVFYYAIRPPMSNRYEEAEEEIAESIPCLSSLPVSAPDLAGKKLDQVLDEAGKTFQEKLFELIDASGMNDVTVYKRANIDRKVFSRIRCNKDYKPKKKTAVAFAIALELDLPTTVDLLSRAEIAFSPSSKFDLIVEYFITNRRYDIYEINVELFRYNQPILGE